MTLRIIARFGLKSTFFLYLFSYVLLAGVAVGAFRYPHFILVGALAYLAAYYVACGRWLFPTATYGAGLLVLAFDKVFPPASVFGPLPVDASWAHLYFPVASGALVLYAGTFAKRFGWKVLSVFSILLAVGLGHVFISWVSPFWRLLVPSLGLAPVFPEPFDAPLYILLYQMWRVVHQVFTRVRC
ncbi:hypothetical protein [Pyrobaculum sp.]|uniref:hypothetical protein n=1 Tax=Pyrobaculum sp. TaxID=2004705 RepID=UPI00315EADC0